MITDRTRTGHTYPTDHTGPVGIEELLTPDDVARALKIGKTKVYALLAGGQIASIRVGRSRRIRPGALRAYLDALTEGAA